MSLTNVPALQPIFSFCEEKMKKSVERLRTELAGMRTGRATATLLDHIRVEYYGSHVPMKQVAAVSVPDGRTIEVKPWDMASLPAIERAIQMSDLGLTPNNDGKLIRLSVPTLTEERRKEMVRVVKKLAEEFRVAVRNDRRDAIEKVKKAEKDKAISEDQRKTAEAGLQGLTDQYVKLIDATLATKEKDIMEI
jgi:ribosome recycling factor